MTRVQVVEQEVKKFDKASLIAFRNWFRKYDAAAWDDQIENDVRSGKINKLAREALRSHKTGKTKELWDILLHPSFGIVIVHYQSLFEN